MDEPNDETQRKDRKDLELVQDMTKILKDQFDTVQIFCTRHEGDTTAHFAWGAGNYFARVGQVSAWLISEENPNEQ